MDHIVTISRDGKVIEKRAFEFDADLAAPGIRADLFAANVRRQGYEAETLKVKDPIEICRINGHDLSRRDPVCHRCNMDIS